MKIEQERPKYKPITITLETRGEAAVFFQMIDGIEYPSDLEKQIIIKISDAFTNGKVTF